jgi:hypothetical protein
MLKPATFSKLQSDTPYFPVFFRFLAQAPCSPCDYKKSTFKFTQTAEEAAITNRKQNELFANI